MPRRAVRAIRIGECDGGRQGRGLMEVSTRFPEGEVNRDALNCGGQAMLPEEAEGFLGELDRVPGLLEVRLGRWAVWPLVRVMLYKEGFRYSEYRTRQSGQSESTSRIVHRLQHGGRLVRQSVALGLESLSNRGGGQRPRPLFISNFRLVQLPDGRRVDPFFGELFSGEPLSSPPLLASPKASRDSSEFTALDYGRFRDYETIFGRYLARQADVRKAAAEMADHLRRLQINFFGKRAEQKIGVLLGRFEARRRLFKRLLRRRGVGALVFYYGLGRMGEVAAARELGIPTIEIQHGAFGPNDPSFKWNEAAVSAKSAMPVPDYILVFGRLWRDMLLSSGFWSEGQVFAVGSAMVDTYRTATKRHARDEGPLQLFFPTQWVAREAALLFWDRFCSRVASRHDLEVNVGIKVHPAEESVTQIYRNLSARHGGLCRVLPSHLPAMEHISQSDICVGYISTCQIEAVGLGVPTFALCGGTVPGGFSDFFGVPDVKSVMRHVTSPEELTRHLESLRRGSTALVQLRERTATFGERLFEPGFVQNAAGVIDECVRRTCATQS